MKKLLIFLLVLTMLVFAGSASVSAKEKKTSDVVSVGLNVLAYRTEMAVSGIVGNQVTFNAEKIGRAMNLSKVDYITVVKLPSSAEGVLYIGSTPVAEGQTLSSTNIALMSFESNCEGESSSSFEITVNGSGYAVKCNVFLLKEVNYSPTVATANKVSLSLNAYSGKMTTGRLQGYDPEGDKVVFEITKYPKNGQIKLVDTNLGTYEYTPTEGYIGSDSFKYAVCDKYGNYSAAAEVSVEVDSASGAVCFDDLNDGAVYVSANRLKSVMSGMQIGSGCYFYPDRQISRADFLVTAMKAVGIEAKSVGNTKFADDADIPSAMKGYVSLACSKNYISGFKTDGELCFCPNEPISRAEAAVILSNIIGYAENGVAQTFADSAEVPSWAKNALNSLVTLGIIQPESSNLAPTSMLTRGEAVLMLDRTVMLIK